MDTKPVRIVDVGRGPQPEGQRLTVMDVFYYLHRGYDYGFIHQALPSLTHEEYDAIVEYVKTHHAELVELDGRVEQRIREGIAAQKAKGPYKEIDLSIPVEVRAARLKAKLKQKIAENMSDHAAR